MLNLPEAIAQAIFSNDITSLKELSKKTKFPKHVNARVDGAQNTPLLFCTYIATGEITVEKDIPLGDWEVSKTLLANGADPSQPNAFGTTPLHVFYRFLVQKEKSGQTLTEEDLKTAQCFLDKATNLTVSDVEGITPIHVTIFLTDPRFLKQILDRKPELSKELQSSIITKSFCEDHQDKALTLLEHGYHFRLEEFLSHALEKQLSESKCLSVAELYFTYCFKKEAPYYDESLHGAAYSGFPRLVDALLKEGYPVDLKNEAGITPLHLAVSNLRVNTTFLLLERNAPVNEKTDEGETPLDIILKIKASDTELKKPPRLAVKLIITLLEERGAKPSSELSDNMPSVEQKAEDKLSFAEDYVKENVTKKVPSLTWLVCRYVVNHKVQLPAVEPLTELAELFTNLKVTDDKKFNL